MVVVGAGGGENDDAARRVGKGSARGACKGYTLIFNNLT